MHISDYPDNASGCCILTGNATDPEGFLNLERPVDASRLGNPAVVSISFLREIASRVGMKTPAEIDTVVNSLADSDQKIAKLEADNSQLRAENEALTIAVGPKLWGKAQHIRKAAGWKGRIGDNRFEAIKKYLADECSEEELEEALCSTDS